jgi:hypothetical protein
MLTYADVCLRYVWILLLATTFVSRMMPATDTRTNESHAVCQHTSAYVSIRHHLCVSDDACYGHAHERVHCLPVQREALRVQHTSASVQHAVCQHTSAYVSIRQHTSAYVGIRQHMSEYVSIRRHTSAYVGIRQHTSAYVSIRQHTSAYVSIRRHTSACIQHTYIRQHVSMCQHTSAYVSIRQRTHT